MEPFEIEEDPKNSSLIIVENEESTSVKVDFVREKIKKGLVIGSCILGGTIIGGPIGLLASTKLVLLATAVGGAAAGAGVGWNVWQRAKETRDEGKTTWIEETPIVSKLENSIYGMITQPELSLVNIEENSDEL